MAGSFFCSSPVAAKAWANPQFLNAFPVKVEVYDPSSASVLRRTFTVLLVPAIVLYTAFLVQNQQGDSVSTSLAPANVFSKHNDALLLGKPGELVKKLWASKLPASAKAWPGLNAEQMMPQVPLTVYVYGSLAEHAIVEQSIGFYSRCGSDFVSAPGYGSLNLPVDGARTGFQASISTRLGNGASTATVEVADTPPIKHGPMPWPGGTTVTRSPGWTASECARCDAAIISGIVGAGTACNHCWISTRTSLCGMTMPAHLTDAAGRDFVRVITPLQNASQPLWVGMKMSTNATWGEAKCGGCNDVLTPAFFDVAPYQRTIVTTSLSIRIQENGYPAFGGYMLDPVGSTIVGRFHPQVVEQTLQSGSQQHLGEIGGNELRFVLGSILVTETIGPDVLAIIGNIGGTMSIIVTLFGVLIIAIERMQCFTLKSQSVEKQPTKM